jgi:hypothetical protein
MVDQWSFDNLIFPPSTTPISSELQELDFITYKLLDYYTTILNNNFGARWNTVMQALGLTHSKLEIFKDGYIVAQSIAFPVTSDTLKQNNFQFPLLSLWREEEKWLQLTTDYIFTESDYVLTLTFPPLSAQQYNRIYPFLAAINKKILLSTFNGSDPLYNNNELVMKEIGLSFMKSNGSKYGSMLSADKSGNPVYFPSLQVKLSAYERNKYIPNGELLTGFDVQGDFVDGYTADVISNFVDGYVDTSVGTISSLSPSSGSINGNTLVIMSGFSFDDFEIFSITLNGVPVVKYTVKNPNLIMLITPPTLNTGTGDVVITDTQGRQITLVGGWSYI